MKMTIEEAISMLIRLKDRINWEVTDAQKKMDSLNMAIEALERMEPPDCESVEILTHEERTKTHACVCISREAAFDEIIWNSDNGVIDAKVAIEALRKLPSVEPERNTGKWIYRKNPNLGRCMQEVRECSACGRVFCDHLEPYKSFCGFCGAKMEVEV